MINEKTFMETMRGQNTPDFSKYENNAQCTEAKYDTVQKAWDLYNNAVADLEPAEVTARLYKSACDQGNNWRQFIILSERHYKPALTLKKIEIILLTMATIKPEDQEPELEYFFKQCHMVKTGKLAKNGRYYNVGRLQNISQYHNFKLNFANNDVYLQAYPIYTNLLKELELA